ncbi:MAG: transglycosylase family protein, partial [Acetobacteraceae bacterium]|nr:transglycosylase family protein [Acetobacteraceae bacterium]
MAAGGGKTMMFKRTILTAIAVAALGLPAAATAALPSSTAQHYQAAYDAVAHKFGARAPGRNIVRWGLAGGKPASSSDVLRSTGLLERMLHPVPVVQATPTAAPASAAAAPARPAASSTASYGGGYSIPGYIVQCESGGNWHAVNPSSGAGGAYQIMPSTWQA